jgi:hypothetical protein
MARLPPAIAAKGVNSKSHHITAQSLKTTTLFSKIAKIHLYCVDCLQFPLQIDVLMTILSVGPTVRGDVAPRW